MKKFLFAAASLILATSASAQQSRMYLLNGDGTNGFIVQNGALLSTFSIAFAEDYPLYPIRIDQNGLVIANRRGSTSMGYDFNGNPTGVVNNLGSQNLDQLLDGGSDGKYTYTARCCSGSDGLFRGDLNFGNQTFFAGQGEYYSSVTAGAGFVFGAAGGYIINKFDGNGQLVDAYNLAGLNGEIAGLSFETATNSLWFVLNGQTDLYNYSLTGQELGHFNVAELGGQNIYGGEMEITSSSVVPEPSTYALMLAGLASVGVAARRRRKA